MQIQAVWTPNMYFKQVLNLPGQAPTQQGAREQRAGEREVPSGLESLQLVVATAGGPASDRQRQEARGFVCDGQEVAPKPQTTGLREGRRLRSVKGLSRFYFIGLDFSIFVFSFEVIIILIISNIMPLGGGNWDAVRNAKLLFTMSLRGYLFFLLKQKSWIENGSSDCLGGLAFHSTFLLFGCLPSILYNKHILLFNGLLLKRRTLKFIIKIPPWDTST